MAKKPNYGFEKRQKEIARKNKKLEKKQRRQEPTEEGSEQPVDAETSE